MALLGCGVALSQPAEFALVPAAAGPDMDAARANGLMETARSIGFTAGPLVGGALGAAGFLWIALGLNALSFLVVAASAALLRARRSPQPAGASGGAVRAREGVTFLVSERDLAITLGGAVAALAFFSMSATAEPFFVTDVLGAGSLAYGVLLTFWTLGMAAGSAGLAHRVGRARLAAGGLVAVLVQGLGIAGGGLSSVLWMALIGVLARRRRARRQERAAAHADPRARSRGAPRTRVRRLQRRAQRRRARQRWCSAASSSARSAPGPPSSSPGSGPPRSAPPASCFWSRRRRAAAAVITNEGRVLHARVQG